MPAQRNACRLFSLGRAERFVIYPYLIRGFYDEFCRFFEVFASGICNSKTVVIVDGLNLEASSFEDLSPNVDITDSTFMDAVFPSGFVSSLRQASHMS